MKNKDSILLEQAYLKVIAKAKTLSEDMGYGPDEDPMYGVPQGVEDPMYGDLFDAVVSNVLSYDNGIYTDRKSGRKFKYDEAAGRLVPIQ
jgi:hypothetical protein